MSDQEERDLFGDSDSEDQPTQTQTQRNENNIQTQVYDNSVRYDDDDDDAETERNDNHIATQMYDDTAAEEEANEAAGEESESKSTPVRASDGARKLQQEKERGWDDEYEEDEDQKPTQEQQYDEEGEEEGGAGARGSEDEGDIFDQIFGSDSDEEATPARGEIKRLAVPKLQGPDQMQALYYVKLPQMLGIDAIPFSPVNYVNRYQGTLVPVENVMRWRQYRDERGEVQRESNTRLVKYGDGSMQLFVGKASFEVSKEDIGHVHLFAKVTGSMTCQAKFDKKLIFKPPAGAITGRLAKTFAERNQAAVRDRKTMVTVANVDAEKAEIMEEQRVKNARRKKAPTPAAERLSREFVEGEDVSIKAIKSNYNRNAAASGSAASSRKRSARDEDAAADEEEEATSSKRATRSSRGGKKLTEDFLVDDDEDEEDEYHDERDEEEEFDFSKSYDYAPDEEEEEEGAGRSMRSGKRRK